MHIYLRIYLVMGTAPFSVLRIFFRSFMVNRYLNTVSLSERSSWIGNFNNHCQANYSLVLILKASVPIPICENILTPLSPSPVLSSDSLLPMVVFLPASAHKLSQDGRGTAANGPAKCAPITQLRTQHIILCESS